MNQQEPNMAPFISDARRHLRFRGWMMMVLGAVLMFVPLLADADAMGWGFAGLFAGLCVALAGVNFYRARKVAPGTPIDGHPDAASPEIRRKMYVKLIWTSALAFPVLTAWTAWDLRQLEAGRQETVSVWWPLAFLYEHLGYWPTVLSLPLLGVFCIGVFVRKIKSDGQSDG